MTTTTGELFPTNYWYVSRPNEIFLDLDSLKSVTRAFAVIRRAMNQQLPIKENSFRCRLDIKSVWFYCSSPKHHHVIIVLNEPLPFVQRVAWSLWMGGDQIRAAYVLERHRNGFDEAELLVTRQVYGFRKPDCECYCTGKHKSDEVTSQCPALIWVLGEHRSADYFPRNHDRVKRAPVFFAYGKVSKTKIARWK